MPVYCYKNPETGFEKDVFQKVNDPHVYEEGGVKWKRVFFAPNVSSDTKIDPNNKRQFLEKTSNAATMGEIWDRSAELSAQRASQNNGVDPVKRNYIKQDARKMALDKQKVHSYKAKAAGLVQKKSEK